MAEIVRLGIVGAGRIAAEHLKVLRSIPAAEAVGLVSRTRLKAQALAAEFGVPTVGDDLADLVDRAQPDGLLILVSADQIYDVTCSALGFGIPLFIEKPPGLFPGETWRLAHLARARGIKTMVGYNRRFYSVFQKGLEIIRRNGPLLSVLVEGHERMASVRDARGHPEHILSRWLYANATHTIDLLRFFGGEVQDMHVIAHRYQEAGGDQFSAIMNFACGAMGTYISHWLSPGGWRVVLYGQGVTVEFQPLESGRWTDAIFQTHEIEPDREDQQHKPGFYRQIAAYCDMVQGGNLSWPGQDLEGAYQTMRLAARLAASVQDRGNRQTG